MRRATADTDAQRFSLQRRATGVRACRRDEDPMWCCYVIESNPDADGAPHFYVGYTESGIMRHLHDHMVGNTRSCAWVRRWGVLRLVEVVRVGRPEDANLHEAGLVSQYKVNYGWLSTRGGCDNNPGNSSCAIPSFWETPADGLLGVRSADDETGVVQP